MFSFQNRVFINRHHNAAHNIGINIENQLKNKPSEAGFGDFSSQSSKGGARFRSPQADLYYNPRH